MYVDITYYAYTCEFFLIIKPRLRKQPGLIKDNLVPGVVPTGSLTRRAANLYPI